MKLIIIQDKVVAIIKDISIDAVIDFSLSMTIPPT
jgi:hypothetical protein